MLLFFVLEFCFFIGLFGVWIEGEYVEVDVVYV